MKMQVALVALVLAFSQLAPMKASAFTPDVEILSLKGYSPETIETTMVARSRAEWRGTAPTKRSPVQRFLYNPYPIDRLYLSNFTQISVPWEL